jgi:DNA-binding NarL/FixJ family response regulator
MTSTIRAHEAPTPQSGLLAAIGGAGREVPVVADDPLLAEALAVALSACGIPARAAVSLPWRSVGPIERSGAALVVLGATTPAAARRTVAVLVADGRRVAVVGGPHQQGSIDGCLEVGAEAVVSGSVALNDLATLLSDLGQSGPVTHAAEGGISPAPAAVPAEIREAHLGLAALTGRERQILSSLMAGRRASMIARRDYVSVHTVRTQIRSILRKLDVHSQVEAVALAHRVGWTPGSGVGGH